MPNPHEAQPKLVVTDQIGGEDISVLEHFNSTLGRNPMAMAGVVAMFSSVEDVFSTVKELPRRDGGAHAAAMRALGRLLESEIDTRAGFDERTLDAVEFALDVAEEFRDRTDPRLIALGVLADQVVLWQIDHTTTNQSEFPSGTVEYHDSGGDGLAPIFAAP